MMVKHIATFDGRLVVCTALFGRMVGCWIIVVQMDCFVGLPTHGVGEIVSTKRVVDRMVPCFEMVDFDQCKWVELLLEKLTT